MPTHREQELQSIRDHQVQLKGELPQLRTVLATGQAAYDKLLDVVSVEQELRDAHLPSLKPIPNIEDHLFQLAAELQWIRRLISDIEQA
jgi:LytS/YehU family sensor histidine kinase